jgi:hypothetical protein
MAAEDHINEFLLAQKNEQAPYYVVSFDVVNCKLLKETVTDNIFVIMKYVYSKLLESEKILNKQVVIKGEKWIRAWETIIIPDSLPVHENTVGSIPIKKIAEYRASFNIDPWVCGDCFEFTVLRDTVSKEEIIKWVYECNEMLNFGYEFHIADAYYETNNYYEKYDKLYRVDCLSVLEQFHKPDFQKKYKRLLKKMNKTK